MEMSSLVSEIPMIAALVWIANNLISSIFGRLFTFKSRKWSPLFLKTSKSLFKVWFISIGPGLVSISPEKRRVFLWLKIFLLSTILIIVKENKSTWILDSVILLKIQIVSEEKNVLWSQSPAHQRDLIEQIKTFEEITMRLNEKPSSKSKIYLAT